MVPKVSIGLSGDTLYTFNHFQIKHIGMLSQKGKDCDSLEYKLQKTISSLEDKIVHLEDGLVTKAEENAHIKHVYNLEVQKNMRCNTELLSVTQQRDKAQEKLKRTRVAGVVGCVATAILIVAP